MTATGHDLILDPSFHSTAQTMSRNARLVGVLALLTGCPCAIVVATTASSSSIPTKQIGLDVHGLPVELPLVGAGTWQYNDTIAHQSLCKAFSAGITMVDTAFGYQNQAGVGLAITDCYIGRREDLFVMTKIPGGLTFAETRAAHHHNLFQLRLSYVDHLMVHFPADWEITKASKQIRQQQWLALEELYYSGKTRSIGISHYCPRHIHDILEVATIIPSINQVEYHIGSQDVDDVMATCQSYNITFMSFSPLCGPCAIDDPDDSLIHGKLVTAIAAKYENVTGSQMALRFIVQQALEDNNPMGGVIPKSNDMQHIRQNMDLFSFNLAEEDMKLLYAATKPAAEKGDCDVP
jgi:diketogulonate reductase-like aldo/keto reductase